MVSPRSSIITAGLLALLAPGAMSAAAEAPLVLVNKVPLGDVQGRIDHLAADLTHHRLFVAELGNDSLGVVDLSAERLDRQIPGVREATGVAYVPDADLVYAASGADGSVVRLDGGTLSAHDRTALGGDADNIRVDPRRHQVVVGYGNGALALLDAASGEKTGELPLKAHPEAFQLEADGERAFVNVPEAGEIAVVDLQARRQVARWQLPGAAGNFPMALDEEDGRLMVVYRDPPTLAVFDTADGKPVARLSTCGDADDIFFDPKRRYIYISCGEGSVAVVKRDGDSYGELTRIPTAKGARTALFVPELDRLYLAVRADTTPAAIWVFQPK